MIERLAGVLGLAILMAAAAPPAVGQQLSVTLEADGATVLVDGEIFTRYLTRSGTKPALWPVIGPTGGAMTRGYPLALPAEHEESDHVHHRSVWFGYEGINGVDFWHEPEAERTRPLPIGSVRHRDFLRADSNGRRATIVTRNDYLDPSGRAVARDERILLFGADAESRWIDVKLTLWSDDQPLKLRDTKEGAFAVRVAGTLKTDAKQGGAIVTSNGDTGAGAWGKPAEWVDYSGPVGGETAGIAILTHPTSYGPRPCWHVRPYGLFAANPFSLRAYGQPGDGGLEVAAGERVKLRYRILLHKGDTQSADIAAAFAKFAAEK